MNADWSLSSATAAAAAMQPGGKKPGRSREMGKGAGRDGTAVTRDVDGIGECTVRSSIDPVSMTSAPLLWSSEPTMLIGPIGDLLGATRSTGRGTTRGTARGTGRGGGGSRRVDGAGGTREAGGAGGAGGVAARGARGAEWGWVGQSADIFDNTRNVGTAHEAVRVKLELVSDSPICLNRLRHGLPREWGVVAREPLAKGKWAVVCVCVCVCV